MKRRLLTVTLFASLVLGACGSGSDSESTTAPKSTDAGSSAGAEPEPTKSADATYFADNDTDAINKAAGAAQRAGAKALSAGRVAACNKVDAYPAWRGCWHALLNPYSRGLGEVVDVFTALRSKGFPPACRAELRDAAQTFGASAARVDGLLDGIDSNRRSRQVASAKHYGTTLSAISRSFAKPFQQLTQVCYSPAELAKIKASPTPTS